MKKNDFAGAYLPCYAGRDVMITDVAEYTGISSRVSCTGCVVFDLSDGTHWLMDDMDARQTPSSLVGVFDIVYEDGWHTVSDEGIKTPVCFLDGGL